MIYRTIEDVIPIPNRYRVFQPEDFGWERETRECPEQRKAVIKAVNNARQACYDGNEIMVLILEAGHFNRSLYLSEPKVGNLLGHQNRMVWMSDFVFFRHRDGSLEVMKRRYFKGYFPARFSETVDATRLTDSELVVCSTDLKEDI